jgi:hypothetical protein
MVPDISGLLPVEGAQRPIPVMSRTTRALVILDENHNAVENQERLKEVKHSQIAPKLMMSVWLKIRQFLTTHKHFCRFEILREI